MRKMELRGVVVELGIDLKSNQKFKRKLVVLRDLTTKHYHEHDVTHLINLEDKELVKKVKEELKRRGIVVVIPNHLKHLEGEK